MRRVVKSEDYHAWIDGLRDLAGRARILVRIDRLIHGNPGDHRNLTEGVAELRIDVGPGYRVYYARRGEQLLLLLGGGSKATQTNDIDKALDLNRTFEDHTP